MGGASSALGEPLRPVDFLGAWVVDCAGDMPPPYRACAGLWLDCVFADTEEIPPIYPRLTALARSLACCLARTGERCDGWEHPHEPPSRLYVLCAAGLNRSGLVMGRILRELGLRGEEALAVITQHRPGALNNLTFARLVRA
ncbi:MAG: hypothetical protein C4290_12815 [Chloroflexota bacterium]